MAALYTNGGLITRTAAQFESYSEIRVAAGDDTTPVFLTLGTAGAVDISAQLGGLATLFTGSAGNDTFTTGAGDDALYGGLGRDVLYGGAGDDRFSAGFGDTV